MVQNSLAGKIRPLFHKRIPGQVVIQITNRCNALCPQCGMRKTADIERNTLPGNTVHRILDGCAENGIQAVSFTGGEPMLIKDNLMDWIAYAGKAGIPFTRTGTNGFLFCGWEQAGFESRIKRLAETMARTPLRNFWISLDSYIPEVHEKMRGLPGVVKGIEKALQIFHAAGIFPSANLGINRFVGGETTFGLSLDSLNNPTAYLEEFSRRYEAAFDRFYRFAHDLGFTMVNTCYPMSIDSEDGASNLKAIYAANAMEPVVNFSKDEKTILYRALLKVIPKHRRRLRIFTPLSALYMLSQSHASGSEDTMAAPCRGGIDFFFVDAKDGNVYPCGYRGNENLGNFRNRKALNPKYACRRCDWECFRDPSEMFAPVLEGIHTPLALLRKMKKDPAYCRLWLKDVRYYQECGFFDGRRPPRL